MFLLPSPMLLVESSPVLPPALSLRLLLLLPLLLLLNSLPFPSLCPLPFSLRE